MQNGWFDFRLVLFIFFALRFPVSPGRPRAPPLSLLVTVGFGSLASFPKRIHRSDPCCASPVGFSRYTTIKILKRCAKVMRQTVTLSETYRVLVWTERYPRNFLPQLASPALNIFNRNRRWFGCIGKLGEYREFQRKWVAASNVISNGSIQSPAV